MKLSDRHKTILGFLAEQQAPTMTRPIAEVIESKSLENTRNMLYRLEETGFVASVSGTRVWWQITEMGRAAL